MKKSVWYIPTGQPMTPLETITNIFYKQKVGLLTVTAITTVRMETRPLRFQTPIVEVRQNPMRKM